MSDANLIFLPCVRQGLAARIRGADPLAGALPAQANLNVALAVNGADIANMNVRVSGPGEVVGIDPRQIVRTEPPAGTVGYESNDLVAVEFDNPDLPWLFTPAAPAANGRLRPWLFLVVVREQPGVRLRPARTELLPVLEIGAPAVPRDELPDLAESWAWAHAQVSAPPADENAVRDRLENRPELSVSRLLSPRLLTPFTDYLACLVPAFDAGRRAGLGEPVDIAAALEPAWRSGDDAPAVVSLPVYFHWRFKTGAREDFESMVEKLVPRDLRGQTGRRPMDIRSPGFAVPAETTPTVELEGALEPLETPREPWPSANAPWQTKLQSTLNAANAGAAPEDNEPVFGPPIYGRWYAQRHKVETAAASTWLDEINLDPRERVAAALGTRVIQRKQEELMADAWQQAGNLASVNQRLRQMQLSFTITTRLHARHVAQMTDDDALWRFASPAQARLVWSGGEVGVPAVTMRAELAKTSTPAMTTSGAMRKLARPRGAIARRASTAVRVEAVAAPQALRSASFFRLFDAPEPLLMRFVLPPTRGLVSFDAVSRRLPAPHNAIVYARATDAAVASAPQQPAFAITVDRTGSTVFAGAAGALAETREAAPTPQPSPTPAAPGSVFSRRFRRASRSTVTPDSLASGGTFTVHIPGRVDSADAKAFREAAQRHLAVVNPQMGMIFAQTVQPAIFQAAAVRSKVMSLLDPAPVFARRLAATIRVGETAPAAAAAAPAQPSALAFSPVFDDPMSETLAELSQDWLLPGLERVPRDTVALLQPNARFIEAFMLGVNVEMGRELLWRDYPAGDPRATYFARFWRAVGAQTNGDVAPLADWGERRLGGNVIGAAQQVVLLVRSELFQRYPNAVVYAVPGIKDGQTRKPDPQGAENHPLFRGSLQPDVTFFGFELDRAAAVGDPGWYFVIQQQPTEPRFGFDVEIEFGGATHVPLAAPPAGHEIPAGTHWGRNSAHMARITQQLPMRIAIHAAELLAVKPKHEPEEP